LAKIREISRTFAKVFMAVGDPGRMKFGSLTVAL
jgi:hypothetical protein